MKTKPATILNIELNTKRASKAYKIVINPGYLRIKKNSLKTKLEIFEYTETSHKKIPNDISLITHNLDIIKIANYKITALKKGRTILVAKKGRLTDSIIIDII